MGVGYRRGEGTAQPWRANLAGHTILVVEEQPLIALDLQRALEGAGAEVVVARNGAEALEPDRAIRFHGRSYRLASCNLKITELWRVR